MAATRLTEKLMRFRELESRDKWMLLHATLWLSTARIMLLVLPFPKIAERLSGEEDAAGEVPDSELLERIGYAVRAAAANVPWRSDCFPQSIAGWMLLRHYGYRSTIHLGVERSGEDELVGHAWLTSADTVVTGGEDLDRYAETHRLGE
jgi:hypothetical protein